MSAAGLYLLTDSIKRNPMIAAFILDHDNWLMIVGIAVMAWSAYPGWRKQVRRYLRHREWTRSPL